MILKKNYKNTTSTYHQLSGAGQKETRASFTKKELYLTSIISTNFKIATIPKKKATECMKMHMDPDVMHVFPPLHPCRYKRQDRIRYPLATERPMESIFELSLRPMNTSHPVDGGVTRGVLGSSLSLATLRQSYWKHGDPYRHFFSTAHNLINHYYYVHAFLLSLPFLTPSVWHLKSTSSTDTVSIPPPLGND